MRVLRGLILAVILIAVAALGWWQFGRGPAVATVAVSRGNAVEVVYATGTVEPVRWAKVIPLQRDRLVEQCDCEGTTVTKGQVLARQDDAEERAVLAELEARRTLVEKEYQRLAGLLERNATTTAQVDAALTVMRENQARISAARERIDALVLRAPMDGVVLRRDFEIGEIVGQNDVVFWVGQPKPLRIVADVNEEDIPRVKRGQQVLLRHDGFPSGSLTATVSEVTPKGDPVAKTFRVYLALPEDSPLLIGMSVEANIVIRSKDNVPLLPAEAIGTGPAVWLDQDGKLVRVPVETGIRGTRMVEIAKGVAPGDLVVSPARADFREGMRVHPASGSRP